MKRMISTLRRCWQQSFLALLAWVVLAAWGAVSQTAVACLGQDQADGPGVKNLKVIQPAFTYQGQLKDASGPVNGVYHLQLTVYSAQTAGEQVASVEIMDLILTNGLFSIKLDFGRAIFEAKENWLEIGVRPGGSVESYTVLSPRQKLTPTPYAIFAQHEQWSLIGVPVGFAGDAGKDTGVVGLNETKWSPADDQARLAKLAEKAITPVKTDDRGATTAETSLAIPCFPQVRCSNPDTAFSAVNIGSGHGVYASSMGSGLASGIVGDNLNSSAGGYGVSGYSFGVAGVFGFGKAATSNGVYGNVNNREGSGVLGRNDGDNPLGSWGVFGFSPKGFAGVFGAGGQNGVFGQTNNKDAFGVFGKNDNGGIGVFGQVVGANGTGVLGRYDGGDNSSGGWGVFGFSPKGYAGVFGSGGKNGVFGVTSSNTDSGVFGKNDGSGFGVFGQALGRDGVGVLGRYDGPATGAGWGVLASASGALPESLAQLARRVRTGCSDKAGTAEPAAFTGRTSAVAGACSEKASLVVWVSKAKALAASASSVIAPPALRCKRKDTPRKTSTAAVGSRQWHWLTRSFRGRIRSCGATTHRPQAITSRRLHVGSHISISRLGPTSLILALALTTGSYRLRRLVVWIVPLLP
jgi:hypothetical protein